MIEKPASPFIRWAGSLRFASVIILGECRPRTMKCAIYRRNCQFKNFCGFVRRKIEHISQDQYCALPRWQHLECSHESKRDAFKVCITRFRVQSCHISEPFVGERFEPKEFRRGRRDRGVWIGGGTAL